jgi:uncharacterized protein involved in outer membrane biogenesis
MKKLLIVGAALILILVFALVVSRLGPIIKIAVNTYGPQLTKTELSLGDVDISLLSGKAELQDFFLGNPKGFNSSEAMKVGSIFIDIDPKSITKDTIVIHTIEVLAPAITYEKGRRTDNFKTIMNNVSNAPEPTGSPKESSSGPGKKIIIEEFVLKQGTVTLATSVKGAKSISTRLPDIHLKNIGGKGASSQQVLQEILNALYKEITSSSVKDSLNQGLKELEKSLGTTGEDAKKQAGGVLKGLFGK